VNRLAGEGSGGLDVGLDMRSPPASCGDVELGQGAGWEVTYAALRMRLDFIVHTLPLAAGHASHMSIIRIVLLDK